MNSLFDLIRSAPPVLLYLGIAAVCVGALLLGLAVDRLEAIRQRQERDRRK
jgi:hypothetical protein